MEEENEIPQKIRTYLSICGIKHSIDLLQGQLASSNMYFKTYDIVNNKVVSTQRYDFLKARKIKETISLLNERLRDLQGENYGNINN